MCSQQRTGKKTKWKKRHNIRNHAREATLLEKKKIATPSDILYSDIQQNRKQVAGAHINLKN